MKIMFFILMSPFVWLWGAVFARQFFPKSNSEMTKKELKEVVKVDCIVGIIILLAFWAFYFI